jgi:hypothetical protein
MKQSNKKQLRSRPSGRGQRQVTVEIIPCAVSPSHYTKAGVTALVDFMEQWGIIRFFIIDASRSMIIGDLEAESGSTSRTYRRRDRFHQIPGGGGCR